MSAILAIDPGPAQSGYVALLDGTVRASGIAPNADILSMLPEYAEANYVLAVEMMRARGMPVSNEEMRTLVWIGRFQQAWRDPEAVRLVYRGDVKMFVCGRANAKDSNIRAGLLELVGPQGSKREPGPTYGVKSHAWAALGVAVTAVSVIDAEEWDAHRKATRAEWQRNGGKPPVGAWAETEAVVLEALRK